MDKINLADKFSLFHEYWTPKLVGELNGQQLKIAKLSGEFIWHHHEDADEMFLVIRGQLQIEFRDKLIELQEGELLVVPKGVEHRPVAKEEVWVLLIETAGTLNTGNVVDDKTLSHLESL
jgi:mannose-6-phosphate isomerase-like protein (cupin superfamily)